MTLTTPKGDFVYMEDYVDLARRFVPFDDETDRERSAEASYIAAFFGAADPTTWDDLLEHPRVVVLGEPGSGKSYELRARTQALIAAGRPAFFLDLRRLVSESVETILGAELAR